MGPKQELAARELNRPERKHERPAASVVWFWVISLSLFIGWTLKNKLFNYQIWNVLVTTIELNKLLHYKEQTSSNSSVCILSFLKC